MSDRESFEINVSRNKPTDDWFVMVINNMYRAEWPDEDGVGAVHYSDKVAGSASKTAFEAVHEVLVELLN